MTAFKAPLDDILTTQKLLAGIAGNNSLDPEISAAVLTEFARFAELEIAPVNHIGDQQACHLTEGGVQMPDVFKEVYRQLTNAGWQGLSAPESYGGMGLDKLTAAGVSEIFSGACHALQMVCNLVPGAIDILHHFGSTDQKQRLIPLLSSGEVLSTMCLTEAGAGSDLSRISCKAEKQNGQWQITGEKIFISGGDQNLSTSILHFVLARTGPVDKGLAGLSLFVCPKHVQGRANGVSVARVEDKLGIHASPTCHMRFDGAQAELIGEEGAGLSIMFTLMNHARLDVALQGVAHAQRAFHLAQTYADERVQGRKSDKSPACLSDHSDVRRMLQEQRALAIGGRAICYQTFWMIENKANPDLVAFLTPLCKCFCSEAGIRAADLGIQILGGYGYLKEYQIEQVWRDARITAIYEGANGIHARNMVTRQLRAAKGKPADDFADMLAALCSSDKMLSRWIEKWQNARKQVEKSDHPEAYGNDFTQLSAHLWFRAMIHHLSKQQQEHVLVSQECAEFARQMAWPVRADWLT